MNMNIFSPHSTYSVSNSKAKTYEPLITILEKGDGGATGDSRSFYNKSILQEE